MVSTEHAFFVFDHFMMTLRTFQGSSEDEWLLSSDCFCLDKDAFHINLTGTRAIQNIHLAVKVHVQDGNLNKL